MMWLSGRLWLLIITILLVGGATRATVWNAIPASLHTSAAVDHSGKNTCLPNQSEVEDSVSTGASTQRSCEFSVHNVESSEKEDVQLSWTSSGQEGSLEVLTERGSIGSYQSLFQHGQALPGLVSHHQLGSSNIETWCSECNGAENSPEGASTSLQQSDTPNSVSSAQDFPSPSTDVWVPLPSVQSVPTHLEGCRTTELQSQSTCLPPEKQHHNLHHVPSLPPTHASQARPVSKPAAILHETKLSPSSNFQSELQSPMGSSCVTFTHHPCRDDSHKGHSRSGHLYSQDGLKGKPSGHHQPSVHHTHSPMWGSDVTSTHHPSKDNSYEGHSRPGHLYSQHGLKGKPSGHHRPSVHHGHSPMWGSDVASTHHRGRDDSRKSHSRPGHLYSQDGVKGKPSGHHWPSGHHAHSPMWGSDVAPTHHRGRDDSHKSHSRPGHLYSQDGVKGKPSGHHRPSGHHAHSHMWGSDVASTHHRGRDDSHKSYSRPGHLYSQDGVKGKPSGHHRRSGHHAHSPMWGSDLHSPQVWQGWYP